MENSNKEHWNNPQPVREDNKKNSGRHISITSGAFGVHKFLLGYTKEGIIWLVISLVTCGSVTALLVIEGIFI
jgi:TM2 domain-containing membrane protein YozV